MANNSSIKRVRKASPGALSLVPGTGALRELSPEEIFSAIQTTYGANRPNTTVPASPARQASPAALTPANVPSQNIPMVDVRKQPGAMSGSFLPPDAEYEMALAEQQANEPATPPSVQSIMADQALMERNKKADAGFFGPEAEGILNKLGFATDNFGARLAMGLAAAGSQDPVGTLLKMQSQDDEIRKAKAEASKPKFTPLAGGAFTLAQFPDGRQQIIKNDEVANYLTDQQETAFQRALEKARVTAQANTQGANDKVVFKDLLEAAGGATATPDYSPAVAAQIGTIDKLLGAVEGIDTVAGFNSPVAAELIDRTYGRLLGTEDYSFRRDLDSLIGKDVLVVAQEMKGALSNADVAFLKAIQPKTDDPTERKLAYLTELRRRIDAGERRRMGAAAQLQGGNIVQRELPAPAGAAPAASPLPAIPGLSPAAQKYLR